MKLIATYFLLFLFYSFIGWLFEVCLSIFEHKKFVNRGFLIGPYCPIYGVGCVLLLICLKKFVSFPLILFFMSIIICSGLEYAVSYLMEKLFKARWWDYSNYKFNVNGRICLLFSLIFGIVGTVVTYIVNPFVMNIITYIPQNILYLITIILAISFIIDIIISYKIIYEFKNTVMLVAKDNTEEINEKVHEILLEKTGLAKRLKKAFPNFKVVLKKKKKKLEKEIKKIKKKIKDSID